jgi:hypothetical protein
MKRLGPNAHAVIDYLCLPPYFVLPRILGWERRTALSTYPVGAFHTLLTLFTNYPLGLVKLIPYTVHGAIEYASVLHLLAWPFVMRFPERSARGYYILASISLLAACLMTDYRALEKRRA